MNYWQGLALTLFLSLPAGYFAEQVLPREDFGHLFLIAPFTVGLVVGILSEDPVR